MTLAFGTWADRAYSTIPKADKLTRTVNHAHRLIQTKYPDPTKCPKAEADIFHHNAVELVRAEDNLELPLGGL